MAIKKIKVGSTEHELQTTIANVTGLESALAEAKAYTDTSLNTAKAYTDTSLDTAKAYSDTVGATVKNDLLNGAGAAYDTLKELGDLIDENTDAIDALEAVAAGKADKSHTHDDRYYTETEIDSKVSALNSSIAGKAASSHSHDDRYYTETEIDSKVSALNSSIAGKAASSHTHTIANITNLQASLDGKSSTSHTHDLSAMINTLSEGSSAPTDADYYVSQYAGGGTTTTTYHRRPLSALWSWIKGKADSVYQAKGSYASSSHTHDDRYYTESEIDSKVSTLNSSISGKANSSHTHDDRYYTESEIDSKVSTLNSAISGKAASSHTHTIANITNLQSSLDGKAASSHTHSQYAPLAGATFTGMVKFKETDGGCINFDDGFYINKQNGSTLLGNNGTNSWVGTPQTNLLFRGNASRPTYNGSNVALSSDIPTIPGAATTSSAGLMSASDKSKLDGIASGANNYTYSLPTASSSTLGGVKTGSNITNSSGTISLTKANVTSALGYTPPTTNTTYGAATTSSAGLMSASDKSKLDGIASGANNYTYSLPTASSSTLGGVKTTSTVTSTSGYTACPIISGVPYYKDTNSTYALSSFGITATATELNYTDGVTSNIQTQLDGKAASSHSHSYTPAGTVSTPTFTGSAATSGSPSGTTSVYSITGVGSVPSLSASYSANRLTLTFSAGSVPTRSSVTVASSGHTHSVTAKGTVSQPTFTGTAGSAK